MTKIKAVLDTNVILSSIFWKGKEHEVVKKGLEGAYVLVTSKDIVDEVVRKLRDKFKFPEDKIGELLVLLKHFCEIITIKTRLKIVTEDPTDDKIIETAVDGNADFIVTGDKHLLKLKEYKGIKILKSREFLKLIEK